MWPSCRMGTRLKQKQTGNVPSLSSTIFIWRPCAKLSLTWSVDISPSCCHVDVLAKPCCGPRGHGPKAGKQTGTPPLQSLRWTFCEQISRIYLIALVPSSIAFGLTKISSSLFTCHSSWRLEAFRVQRNYDDRQSTIMIRLQSPSHHLPGGKGSPM